MQTQAISGLQSALQEKDKILEKVKQRTLSSHEWQQIGQDRALQFSVLDSIIGECDKTKGGYKSLVVEASG